MSLWEILDTVLLKSLELLFEVVYVMADKVIGNPGLSIVALSLFMNFLILPLYMRADAIQEEEQAIEKKLQKGVEHIKKTFRGDERMMMLQTYYRQNHYKPVYVLRSAVSLFLQIPFFIAAYRFLSGLQLISGISFGPIADLGSPDGMLRIGGVAFHVLPIVMTAVNLASCAIFTKGGTLKSKIQLYAMALFFLVFLYDSPAGLVFYWTLNNVFSLVKTCFYKLKNPRRMLGIVFSVLGFSAIVYSLFIYHASTFRKRAFLAEMGLLMQMPLVYHLLKDREKRRAFSEIGNKKMFLSGGLFLAVLTGALIPSAVIKASPLEFIEITKFYHPLWFVASASCLAFGVFVIWTGIFYFLAKPITRVYFERGIGFFAGIAVMDYLFFGKDLGLINAELSYAKGVDFTGAEQLQNLAAVATVMAVIYVIYKHWEKLAADILIIGTLAVLCMTLVNVSEIHTVINGVKERDLEHYAAVPEFTFSRRGKNVIVLMLDRAVGEYIPYLFQEKPELEKQFSGFTYYANTISFGAYTQLGSPALFGGYEYTPVEINKRDKESLVRKHDEALRMMPVLFGKNGYQVTVCDPPYAGYQEIPDLSIYEMYPEIQSYILRGKFTKDLNHEQMIINRRRNFFCFGILKTVPLCLQKTIYDYGRYNQAHIADTLETKQVQKGLFHAMGIEPIFMDQYNVLTALPDISKIIDEDKNTFLMMTNDLTHEPMMLQEPEYVPAMEVDNEEYENSHQERFTLGGRTLRRESNIQITTYQINMAAMLQLGKWFDYMRDNGVYDNTRIILAADHGRSFLFAGDDYRLGGEDDIMRYYPLLMMKDFGGEQFATSEEFMTNGDVPTLAVKDIIENPVNPFTGNKINSDEKAAHKQYVVGSNAQANDREDTTFLSARWYSVHSDMRNPANWELVAEDAYLPPSIEK